MVLIILSIIISLGIVIIFKYSKTNKKVNEESINNPELEEYYDYKIYGENKIKMREALLRKAAVTCLVKIKRLTNKIERLGKLYEKGLISEEYLNTFKRKEDVLVDEKMVIEMEAVSIRNGFDEKVFKEVNIPRNVNLENNVQIMNIEEYKNRRKELLSKK
ncbi:hypothetical protein A0H76_1583 [Hepatospora eriocheir]|uniref:Uncharacterized protein n=1 Tax=Hepatospora eriocheir TaxID=1081669 RepID=A0A1X0QKL8_9MICR|nr:hypothetical protein A0H76_1583 [Hepatospora eriocheir]